MPHKILPKQAMPAGTLVQSSSVGRSQCCMPLKDGIKASALRSCFPRLLSTVRACLKACSKWVILSFPKLPVHHPGCQSDDGSCYLILIILVTLIDCTVFSLLLFFMAVLCSGKSWLTSCLEARPIQTGQVPQPGHADAGPAAYCCGSQRHSLCWGVGTLSGCNCCWRNQSAPFAFPSLLCCHTVLQN